SSRVSVLSRQFSVENRYILTDNWELRTGSFLCGFHQRTQLIGGDPQRAPGEAVNVGGIDTHDFAAQVQHRSAAASTGRGRVIDQLVAGYIADVPKGRRGPDQRYRCQFARRVRIIRMRRKALI